MNELWRDIPKFEGKYQVSSLGRVKSFQRSKSGMILKSTLDGVGYPIVSLGWKNNKKIHKIMEIVFADLITTHDKATVIDHIDGDRSNNLLSNLRRVTQRENVTYGKSSTGLVGCYWNKRIKQWHSQIRINGKPTHIGYFNSEDEAHQAYIDKLNSLG